MKRGRTDLTTQETRRAKVKEYYLQGQNAHEISLKVGAAYETVVADINYWKTYYAKLATNNPHIVSKQIEKVAKLLDESEIIKKEFWSLYEELKNKSAEEKAFAEKELAENPDKKRVEAKLYLGDRIDALKAIMNRIEAEARLLNLFNPVNLQGGNFISIDVLKEILMIVKNIITEFIPAEKQCYAIERMKQIKLDNTIDAEFKEEK
jgi:hypothetical protein